MWTYFRGAGQESRFYQLRISDRSRIYRNLADPKVKQVLHVLKASDTASHGKGNRNHLTDLSPIQNASFYSPR